jgi:histone chaperone ASF1
MSSLDDTSHSDLEWRLIYVASPGNAELDQELDDCLVGPVPLGVNAFEFEGSPPSPQGIPRDDVLGVAALILTGSYRDQEFVRVGYYQNTEYDNEEMRLNPPQEIQFDKLVRDINLKPRVTRFQIKWYVLVIFQRHMFDRHDLAGMSHHKRGQPRRQGRRRRRLFPLQMSGQVIVLMLAMRRGLSQTAQRLVRSACDVTRAFFSACPPRLVLL